LFKDFINSEESRSWGVVVAITIALILIAYAVFSTSGPGSKLSRNSAMQTKAWERQQERQEDMREAAAEGGNRRINVKKGQNVVIF